MSRARLKGGSVRLVVLVGLVTLTAVPFGGTSPLSHKATPNHPNAPTDATNPSQSHEAVLNTKSNTADSGWNTARANAANTNYINTTGPTNPITVRWAFASDGDTFSAGPLVTNGTVYFATRHYGSHKDGKVYAVDAWTGKVRWTFTKHHPAEAWSIAVLRNTVYIGGGEKVYALDTSSGDVFWSFRTSKVFSLTVANRTLFVRDRHHVYALGALRGEENWRFKAPGRGRPTGLAVKANTGYVSTSRGYVIALDAKSGSVTWNTNVVEDTKINNKNDVKYLKPPVVTDEMVYVTHIVPHKQFSDSNFYALDAKTGEPRWTRTAPRAENFSDQVANGFSSPSILEDTIYFSGKYLHAVVAQTGNDRWSESTLRGSPVLLSEIGYISTGQTLYTLDPTSGVHHARFTPQRFNNRGDGFASGLAVLNGSLYTGIGIDRKDSGYSQTERTIFYALGTPVFNYTNLSVTPVTPDLNETVNVTATVRNTGTGPGTFNATMAVNGNVTNATTDRLAPRTNTTVTFPLVIQQNGTYTVGIGNLTRTITVGNVAPGTKSTATPQGNTKSPTRTPTSEATATVAGPDSTPTATPTSGTVPGFGVGVSIVTGAVVAVVLGRRLWN